MLYNKNADNQDTWLVGNGKRASMFKDSMLMEIVGTGYE